MNAGGGAGGGTAPDAPTSLALATPTYNRTPGFDVWLALPQVGDVLRWKRVSVTDGTVTVDHTITQDEIAANVFATGFGTLPNETYDFSVAHGRGGNFSAYSNVVTTVITDAQAAFTFGSTSGTQSGTNPASPYSVAGRALPNGHKAVVPVIFYSVTAANAAVMTVDGRPCTKIVEHFSSHLLAVFITNDVCISSSGTIALTYTGTPFVIIIGDPIQADHVGGLGGSVSYFAGSGSNVSNITTQPSGAGMILSLVAGGTPSITWTGSTAGTFTNGLKVSIKNSGNTTDSVTLNPGAYHFDWFVPWSNWL
ncbi:hypothetical protein [Aestuariivirga sp.]|uniref:hypothetical protein n=1 Tax=Aestuariivirga sp. TaxID=2650926 RepID=UPI0039E3D0AC